LPEPAHPLAVKIGDGKNFEPNLQRGSNA